MFGVALRAAREGVRFAAEPWSAVAEEAQAIGAEHFAEVENGLDPRRKFNLATRLMQGMDAANMMLILTARIGGRLEGYFTWQITEDVESEGLLIAQQGAWFVRPGFAGYGLWLGLWKLSLSELKARGVKCIFPHHRLQGRGVRLGLLFRRYGAVETQRTYMLWIGND